MLNPIKEIAKWQHDAGNASKPYNDFLESSFQIEEALEGFESPLRDLTLSFDGPKNTSRAIVSWMQRDSEVDFEISDVDRLDKACDAIVFAIGSMCKLGLDHYAITKALNIVNTANKAKIDMPRDEHGKLLKPDDWEKYAPELLLQKLLDERKN